MKRRTLLGLGTGAAALAMGGGWFTWSVRAAPHPHFGRLSEVRSWLAQLDLTALQSRGVWSAAQILSHCAQSLEYSLVGFPEPKPEWFRSSVGPLAFAVFDGLGAMRHDLSQPVPGSTLDDLDTDLQTAVDRLHAALTAFEDEGRPLAEHFAYGALSRSEFDRAHAMHISEHVGELT